jgi:hypothetical protein
MDGELVVALGLASVIDALGVVVVGLELLIVEVLVEGRLWLLLGFHAIGLDDVLPELLEFDSLIVEVSVATVRVAVPLFPVAQPVIRPNVALDTITRSNTRRFIDTPSKASI